MVSITSQRRGKRCSSRCGYTVSSVEYVHSLGSDRFALSFLVIGRRLMDVICVKLMRLTGCCALVVEMGV